MQRIDPEVAIKRCRDSAACNGVGDKDGSVIDKRDGCVSSGACSVSRKITRRVPRIVPRAVAPVNVIPGRRTYRQVEESVVRS